MVGVNQVELASKNSLLTFKIFLNFFFELKNEQTVFAQYGLVHTCRNIITHHVNTMHGSLSPYLADPRVVPIQGWYPVVHF